MPTLITSGFTPEQEARTHQVLKEGFDKNEGMWDGGPISDDIFTILAYITPQAIIEVVPTRHIRGKIEVLVIQRPKGDKVWGEHMFHTPGVAQRRGDHLQGNKTPLDIAFDRILQGELQTMFARRPELVAVRDEQSDRGTAVARIFVVRISDDTSLPGRARWIPVSDLAFNRYFIQSQLEFVRLAADYYHRRFVSRNPMTRILAKIRVIRYWEWQ